MAFSTKTDFEFLVMCDSATEATVRSLCQGLTFPVHLWRMPDASTPQAASMQKLRIFQWPELGRFRKILFLDADIIVALNMAELLAQPIRDDALFVYRETTDHSFHQHIWFSLHDAERRCLYTEDELQTFKDRDTFPFNAGLFIMLNTATMRGHFDRILELVASHRGYYFFEQSFLNYYFNRAGKADYSLVTDAVYAMHPKLERLYTGKIIHFTLNPGDGLSKAQVIERYVQQFFAPCLPFATREQMIRRFVLPGARIAELGTFRGDFAEFLLELNPACLHLVDAFTGTVGSGDVNGNGFQLFDGEELRNFVRRRFAGDARVQLHKCTSTQFLTGLPDASLDAVYIDADHSYTGCMEDLELARSKVRTGGLIMGHDYEMNADKTSARYDFGVKKAVDEFCSRYELRILAKAFDGCVSFCIVNSK